MRDLLFYKTRLLVYFLMGISIAGCSAITGISGTVVDDETGKPIEGAVVLVEWTKEVGIGDYRTDSVKVVESVTDQRGHFRISGVFSPFVETPDLTIYKRGYVAWNNKTIFPEMEKREDFKWQKGYLFKMTKFLSEYSHNQHLSFIRSSTKDILASSRKKTFAAAYEWEIDLAREEVLREK